jgi:ribosomal-protein-serine acetyltransferase
MLLDRISDNLELRLLQLADAEELFALTDANRLYLRQWLPWLDTIDRVNDTRDFIARTLKQLTEQEGLAAAICDRGKIVGLVGFNRIVGVASLRRQTFHVGNACALRLRYENRQDRIGYIGYWLAESAQGKGMMTKSCQSLINYGFTTLKLDRMVIACATENYRSRAVPLRLGFVHTGVIRDAEWLYQEFVEHDMYALSVEDWKKS